MKLCRCVEIAALGWLGCLAIFSSLAGEAASTAKHWAYIKPETPPLPRVKASAWPKNPIDYFVLARLEKEGLAPSLEAPHASLLRRVTLDLTGLPPTLEESESFARDTSHGAYERAVDRLLESPAYGER